MSTRRKSAVYSTERAIGANGRRACLVCTGDIADRKRKTFCSARCADNHYMRTRPEYVRKRVFDRDRGVCRSCGRNTLAGTPFEAMPFARQRVARTGHLWQPDHIVEVADGGGECGLEGYQTLCTPCHKAKTAASRRARAKQSLEQA